MINHRAKRYGLTPRSLFIRPLVGTQEGRNIAKRTSRRFLSARITENVRKIRGLEHDLYFQRRQLEHELQSEHLDALEELRLRAYQQMSEKCKQRQMKKFDRLLDKENSKSDQCVERWVINRSSRPLTTNE